jgi:hypothetical protein
VVQPDLLHGRLQEPEASREKDRSAAGRGMNDNGFVLDPTNEVQSDAQAFARPPVGRADHLDTFTAEDLVEGCAELGVAIPEQEPGPQLALLEPPGQVRSLLGLWGAEWEAIPSG